MQRAAVNTVPNANIRCVHITARIYPPETQVARQTTGVLPQYVNSHQSYAGVSLNATRNITNTRAHQQQNRIARYQNGHPQKNHHEQEMYARCGVRANTRIVRAEAALNMMNHPYKECTDESGA